MNATPVCVIRRRLVPRRPQEHGGTLLLRQPRGPRRELRAALLDTPAGPELVAYLWRQNAVTGTWYPCPRGLRVPAADLPAFADAIGRAVGISKEPRG